MAWPASRTILFDRFTSLNRTALRLRAQVKEVRDKAVAGPVVRQTLLELQRYLDDGYDRFAAIGSLPQADRDALVAYARDQFNDPALDVVGEFVAMRDGALALRDWINANFPRDAVTGAVLTVTVDANGLATPLTFTVAQLAGFVVQADAFLATIS